MDHQTTRLRLLLAIREYNIRQDDEGATAARKNALHQSKGGYLIFLDTDERLLPEALEAGLVCMKAHPACAFVSGHYTEGTVVAK